MGKDKGGDSGGVSTPQKVGVSTPGFNLSTTRDPAGTTFGTTLTRTGSAAQTAGDERLPRILSDLDVLRGTIAPGSSLARKARLQAIEDARQRSVSNLKDNLARRGIAGSSFAVDALNRTNAEFARSKDIATAESFLQEFDLNRQVLSQETGNIFQALQAELNELAAAAGQANQFLATATQTQLAGAAAAAAEAQATGQAIGTVVGAVAGGIFFGPVGAVGGAAVGGQAGAQIGGVVGGQTSSTSTGQSSLALT